MSKGHLIKGGLVAAAASALAMAPAASAKQPDGTACGAQPGASASCSWTADVGGEYAGAALSWSVVQVTHDANGNEIDIPVASGSGPFATQPGTLTAGNTYRLTVSGGGGAIGSATGTGTA